MYPVVYKVDVQSVFTTTTQFWPHCYYFRIKQNIRRYKKSFTALASSKFLIFYIPCLLQSLEHPTPSGKPSLEINSFFFSLPWPVFYMSVMVSITFTLNSRYLCTNLSLMYANEISLTLDLCLIHPSINAFFILGVQ